MHAFSNILRNVQLDDDDNVGEAHVEQLWKGSWQLFISYWIHTINVFQAVRCVYIHLISHGPTDLEKATGDHGVRFDELCRKVLQL